MSGSPSALADLFPEGDFRFHVALRRGEPRDFFRRQDQSGALLAERARWIAEEATRYAAMQAEGEPALREFAAMAAGWGHLAPATVEAMGAALEPDILFMMPDSAGHFRLRGGALCFPTGWALEDKIGHPMDFIHGVVPGLNAALATAIHQILSKLKPGVAFLRDNWGITATDELNLHPTRRIPAPAGPVDLDRLWLRVEHQALVALPGSRGVVFGIRIALHRLDALAGTRAGAGLRAALITIPTEMAVYKRIDEIRAKLIALL